MNIKIWDVASGEVHNTLEGHKGPVETVDWSPDGLQVASGDFEGIILVFDYS